ncbi:Hypothetical predicted protein [Podarcis lilfordi]|uniref:Uncharacterized protein n=1 Tax=Podarcis lilfordi TaxID=74358 RepID=A0AA35K8H4_9SAUR|nr:Hypothetical predicted protein [Podarcis lilfordi]
MRHWEPLDCLGFICKYPDFLNRFAPVPGHNVTTLYHRTDHEYLINPQQQQ